MSSTYGCWRFRVRRANPRILLLLALLFLPRPAAAVPIDLLVGYPDCHGPSAVLVDGAGVVYATCKGVLDAQTGTWSQGKAIKIASDGTVTVLADEVVDLGAGVDAPLEGPRGIALDAEHLYVAAESSNNVFRLELAGGSNELLFEDDPNSVPRLLAPMGIVVDSADRVYVAGSESDNVIRITAPGVAEEVLTYDPAPGPGPGRLAIDASDNVYSTTLVGAGVYRIPPVGLPTLVFEWLPCFPAGPFYLLASPAVASDGTLVVPMVQLFRATEPVVDRVVFIKPGDDPCDASDDVTFVTDGTVGLADANRPAQPVVDAAGNVYVPMAEDDSVRFIFNDDGKVATDPILTAIDPASTALTQPAHAALGPDGTLYAASFERGQILREGPPRAPADYGVIGWEQFKFDAILVCAFKNQNDEYEIDADCAERCGLGQVCPLAGSSGPAGVCHIDRGSIVPLAVCDHLRNRGSGDKAIVMTAYANRHNRGQDGEGQDGANVTILERRPMGVPMLFGDLNGNGVPSCRLNESGNGAIIDPNDAKAACGPLTGYEDTPFDICSSSAPPSLNEIADPNETIVPGVYNDVTVPDGQTALLESDDYTICGRLKVSKNATLKAADPTGTVRLFVGTDVILDNSSALLGGIRVNVSSPNGPTDPAVKLGKNSTVEARICAPENKIKIEPGATGMITGRIIGRKVEGAGTTNFWCD